MYPAWIDTVGLNLFMRSMTFRSKSSRSSFQGMFPRSRRKWDEEIVTSGISFFSTKSKKLSVALVCPRMRLTKTNSNFAFKLPDLMASNTARNMPRDPSPFAVVSQPTRR